MRQSLFALFRGTEGRSLARALAALMFVAAIAGQLPLGLHAAAADGPAICSVQADPVPASGGEGAGMPACCLAICVGVLAPLVTRASPELALPAPLQASAHPVDGTPATALPIIAAHRPRGPPFLV